MSRNGSAITFERDNEDSKETVFPSATPVPIKPVAATQSLLYTSRTIPSLTPSLASSVQLSLTITYIVVFGLIFFMVYIQLWMIWYYRHKRLSHQTLFLFQCLIWAGLRTSLFSFYFRNCKDANNLDTPLYWVFYCLPVCLQFSMLCLLLHFYAQIVFKTRARYKTAHYKYPLRIFLCSSVVIFMVINLACAIMTKHFEKTNGSVPLYLLYVRISLNESMFLIYGILMSVCIYKVAKTPATRSVLEATGSSVGKALFAAVIINLLFFSRAIYNLVSICPCKMNTPGFGYDWINVSDQADVTPRLGETMAYVSFGVVLFVWEVLPIFIVIIMFRVKRHQTGQVLTDFSTQSHGSKVFFFDNPRRYDSEDDLSSQAASSYQYDVNSSGSSSRLLNGNSQRWSSDHVPWGGTSGPSSYPGTSSQGAGCTIPPPQGSQPAPSYNSINASTPTRHPHIHGNLT